MTLLQPKAHPQRKTLHGKLACSDMSSAEEVPMGLDLFPLTCEHWYTLSRQEPLSQNIPNRMPFHVTLKVC